MAKGGMSNDAVGNLALLTFMLGLLSLIVDWFA